MALRHYPVNWGIAAFLLLNVFTPTAYGGFYATLFSIGLFSTVYLLLKSIKLMRFDGILIFSDPLLLLMALITLSVTITLTLNASFFSIIGLSDIAQPIAFMLFFVFAVQANLNYSMPEIKKTLVLVSKIIIVGQVIVVIDQIFGIKAFSVIYDYGKTSTTGGLESFMRSTGTLFNPNDLAWNVMQCAIIIYLFSSRMSRYLWLFLTLIIILLTGSKAILGLYPAALLFSGWLKGDRGIITRKNIYILSVMAMLIFAIYQFLIIYPDIFPRLKYIFLLLSGEDESGGGRFAIWEEAYAYFLSKGDGLITWLFGMGPIEAFRTVDNGYLYTLFRHGVVGLLLHIILILYFVLTFYKFGDREFGALGVQYVVMASLHELVVEGLAGWNDPIRLFLYAGLVFSYEYRSRSANKVSNRRSFLTTTVQNSR